MKIIFRFLILVVLATTLQSCALLSAAGLGSQGQPVKEVEGELEDVSSDEVIVDHSQWDALLKKYVADDGNVDYEGFKTDKAELQDYLNLLKETVPADSWKVEELLAYYINLYNAHTVKLIVDNHPLNSIKDIDGPWTKAIVPVGDKNLSLGGIENGILRKMSEPRIHFAINCASISCPRLLNEAFKANKIEEQLELTATDFINSDKNEISANNPKLSSIFKWYSKDYLVNGKADVIAYINQYSETKIDPSAQIEYLEYNWNLNEQ